MGSTPSTTRRRKECENGGCCCSSQKVSEADGVRRDARTSYLRQEGGCSRGPRPENSSDLKRRDVSPGTVHRLLDTVHAVALSVGDDFRAFFHAHFMGPHLGASVLSPLSISVTSIKRKSDAVRIPQHPRRHLCCGLTGSVRGIFGDHGDHSCVSGDHDLAAERWAEASSCRALGLAFCWQYFAGIAGTICFGLWRSPGIAPRRRKNRQCGAADRCERP